MADDGQEDPAVETLRVRLVERVLSELVHATSLADAAASVTWALHLTGAVGGAEIVRRTEDATVVEPSLVVAQAGSTRAARDVARSAGPGLVLRVEAPRVPDACLEVIAEAHAGVAERLADLARLHSAARTDPLTGLRNRRAFVERLETDLARADRLGEEIALLLIDVDDLKLVNDDRGHPAGDRALQRVADALRRNLRTSDLAARIGGDEYAMLLPGTDTRGALALTERIRADLAEERQWPVGVSMGVATTRTTAASPEALLAAADRRMYTAKAAGKGRVATADPATAASGR